LIKLEENQFDEILANDVLEHVPNLESLMGNCLKLLKVEGKFIINVPFELSYGAWQDPTHIRAFNQNSWLYYTDWFWYLGWFEHKFTLTELHYTLSKYGQEMLNQKVDQQVLLVTPRAIDAMRVVLTKRETTPEEKSAALSFRNDLIS
jgi:SAM-dependent methyltransferase